MQKTAISTGAAMVLSRMHNSGSASATASRHSLSAQNGAVNLSCDTLRNLQWQRASTPLLSTLINPQAWSTVELYNPTVVYAKGKYRMWYLGGAFSTRCNFVDLGYAESDDGLKWRPHPENPIMRHTDLPRESAWQTPHVMYDEGNDRFRMWFTIGNQQREANGKLLSITQNLAYAESKDGLSWDVHPEVLYPTLRRPCVLIDEKNQYRMWANSSPGNDDDFSQLVQAIYGFSSHDGKRWIRDREPSVTPSGRLRSVVYPFVMRCRDGYVMWYGGHIEDKLFESFVSISSDGIRWTHYHDPSIFPASRRRDRFDGRYTSMPCVLLDKNRALLYYSARDLDNLYARGDGRIGYDAMGVYRHIGVAVATLNEGGV